MKKSYQVFVKSPYSTTHTYQVSVESLSESKDSNSPSKANSKVECFIGISSWILMAIYIGLFIVAIYINVHSSPADTTPACLLDKCTFLDIFFLALNLATTLFFIWTIYCRHSYIYATCALMVVILLIMLLYHLYTSQIPGTKMDAFLDCTTVVGFLTVFMEMGIDYCKKEKDQ